MSKLTMLAAFGAGYVLGSRAGRERYDQIAAGAQRVWRDPRVQHKATQAQGLASEKASQVASAAGAKASEAAQSVREKVTSDGNGTATTGP